MSNIGYQTYSKISKEECLQVLCRNNVPRTFRNDSELAGYIWYKLFLRRYPELSQRKAQSMNPARAQKLNPYIVQDHFKKLKIAMDNINVRESPERVYNIDEKGCRLTLHHSQVVLAPKGTRRVHLVSNEHAENVTIVACVNALGQAIPPMIIFKGSRLKETYKDNLPPGATVSMAEKGSMTRELFITWINHLAKFKPNGKILVILDGASCHLDISVVAAAEEHDIVLYCLPANTTHELQPLDKAVFRAFEHYWDLEVMQYWEDNPSSYRTLKKERFGKVFTPVWRQCMTISNIQSGFRSTGIFPYDPQAIPEAAFGPSTVTHREHNEGDDSNKKYDGFDSEDDIPLINFVKDQSNISPKPGCSKVTITSKGGSNNSQSNSKVKILNVTILKPARTKKLKNQTSTSNKENLSTFLICYVP